jgi:hypothetical protein
MEIGEVGRGGGIWERARGKRKKLHFFRSLLNFDTKQFFIFPNEKKKLKIIIFFF